MKTIPRVMFYKHSILILISVLLLKMSHAFTVASPRAKSYHLGATSFPAMSPDEIESWMSKVPVYAVTESGSGGVVLLKGGAGKEVCNFFTHVEEANRMMRAIQNANPKQDEKSMVVRPFFLGVIWFGLLFSCDNDNDSDDDRVEYRLVPSQNDLNDARDLSSSNPFATPFGDIPIFINWQLRIIDEEKEVLPLYLCLEDIQTACGGFDSSSEYEIKVQDLKALVTQMQKESNIDFRSSLLIPPIAEEGKAKKEEKERKQGPIVDGEGDWS